MRVALQVAIAIASAALPALSQDEFFMPEGSFAVEVSLDNAPYLRLPIYRNAITSLAVVGDYAVGGTAADAGLSPYVFTVSLSKRRLESAFSLDKAIAGQRAILSGFGRGKDGTLFAGTMPDRAGESGHLLSIQLKGAEPVVADLGTPVPGEGVFALVADPESQALYGISHPSGRFFVFRTADRTTDVYTQTVPSREARGSLHDYALKPEDALCRRLVLDREGRVYGSYPINKLFRFDPRRKEIEVLPDELPHVWQRSALGRVDAWAAASDGALYGGNGGDGQLFRLDPSTGRVTNLGKPAMMPRLNGLAFASDGALWGISGGAPGYSHLFRYDARRGFTDYGNPQFTMTEPGIEVGILWRGFQLGTIAASEDGRWIVLGEQEALSQLMVFPAVQ